MQILKTLSQFWRSSAAAQGFLCLLLALPLFQLLSNFSQYFWYLPSGARFTAFILLPRRFWAWVYLGECLVRAWRGLPFGSDYGAFLFVVCVPPLASMFAIALLYRAPLRQSLAIPAEVFRLLLAMLISSALESSAMTAFLWLEYGDAKFFAGTMALKWAGILLGDLVGILLLCPPALILAQNQWPTAFNSQRKKSLLTCILLALTLMLLAWLVQAAEHALLREYARYLSLAVPSIAALALGWKGASIASLLTGLTLAVPNARLVQNAPADVALVLLYCLVVIFALLLGATVDAQRSKLGELEKAYGLQQRLSAELRQASQRILNAEERERARLAAEIHDDLGQNLTALATWIKLAKFDSTLPSPRPEMELALSAARGSIKTIVHALGAPALKDTPLADALRFGPIQRMLEHAGLAFEFRLSGEPNLQQEIPEIAQIALWRIAQEAASNILRHARAKRVRLWMRLGRAADQTYAVMIIHDDGVGLPLIARSGDGNGLQIMRDRCLAFSGRCRIKHNRDLSAQTLTLMRGTTVQVLLRLAYSSPKNPPL